MKIIIPMAGQGKRFEEAGYKVAKPLIVIAGKPIIEHVVNMFPGEEDFVFICNKEHLEKTNLEEVLNRIKPKGKIIWIEFKKFGPVWGILQALNKDDFINDEEPVIVNYCDFSVWWDYGDFKRFVIDTKADGCITAYKGFHPHSLGPDYYGYMRWKADGEKNIMLEIKEKEPFTNNKMDEFAACGCYYFRKGAYIKKFFKELIDKNMHKNGEFYVSLVYNLMNNEGLITYTYEVEHFLQWGTPTDLKEYEYWSNIIMSSSIPEFTDNTKKKIYEYWKSFFQKCCETMKKSLKS